MFEDQLHVSSLIILKAMAMGLHAFLVAQMVTSLPAMQETQVQIPGWGASPGEGNGNPLPHSCLDNPMERGAWWAIVHGVADSDKTEQLKLSFPWVSI